MQDLAFYFYFIFYFFAFLAAFDHGGAVHAWVHVWVQLYKKPSAVVQEQKRRVGFILQPKEPDGARRAVM